MGPFFGLVMLGAMFYGAYVLVRVIIALAKKQEMKPWLLKLGASFVVFVIAGAGVGASSGGSSGGSYVSSDKQGNAVATTSAPQKTPEEVEQEKARQAALDQRKKEQEQKRSEEQQKQLEWEAKQEQKRKEEQERNKYQTIHASALLNEIRSNAARAKHNFNGKYLRIQGMVINIESNGDYITISDGQYNIAPSIQCYPRNNKALREKLFRYNIGDYITVCGKVTNIGEIVGCYFDLEKIE